MNLCNSNISEKILMVLLLCEKLDRVHNTGNYITHNEIAVVYPLDGAKNVMFDFC